MYEICLLIILSAGGARLPPSRSSSRGCRCFSRFHTPSVLPLPSPSFPLSRSLLFVSVDPSTFSQAPLCVFPFPPLVSIFFSFQSFSSFAFFFHAVNRFKTQVARKPSSLLNVLSLGITDRETLIPVERFIENSAITRYDLSTSVLINLNISKIACSKLMKKKKTSNVDDVEETTLVGNPPIDRSRDKRHR